MSEDAWLAKALAGLSADPDAIPVGPGDDAAVLRTPEATVVTTDVIVDGVHFDSSAHAVEDIAHKALAINVSDLAAMGARPIGCLVGGVLPSDTTVETFQALMASLRRAAERLACPLLGGDTNRAEAPLVLAVTALGQLFGEQAVLRGGGEAGDQLSVTGSLGGSILERHLHVRPRLDAAEVLVEARIAKAMMDLSDGLSRDLPRLARASGVAARLVASEVPIHADVHRMASRNHPACRESSLAHALHDGEDFELLVAHAPLDPAQRQALGRAGVVLHPVGRLEAGPAGRVLLERGEGRAATVEVLEARGFDHLAP